MGYTASQAKDFIKKIAPLIQAEAKERGYTIVSTVIAQAIIEGAAGTSLLAKKYANHFGLKCGSSWKGDSVNLSTKEEYTAGTLTTIKDNFRAYLTNGQPDDAKGVKGYYDFISTKRYANLKTAKTYKEYAERLKADGYATSSTYVNTLCSTVKKYELDKYDSGNVVEDDSIYKIGSNYTLQVDLYVRSTAAGTKLKYDALTLDAKNNARYDNYGCAILKKGTVVTCKEVKQLATSTWIKIPSGWICAVSKANIYLR